ncbi:MAG: BON domain-containing protein [Pseudomonadota bacterium]
MNKLVILALASAISSSFAYAADNDTAAYKSMKDRADSDYKVAKQKCGALTGNAKDICKEEAKVAQAHALSDAVAQHKANATDIRKAHEKVAKAEYELAKEKCDDLSGAAKSTCKSDAKAAKATAIAAAHNVDGTTPMASNTAVLTRDKSVAATTADTVRDKTVAAADTMRDKSANAADTMRDKTAAAGDVMSDTVITTKVKADLAADPGVKALDVHVETVKGVVMLSGFVPTKAEADKAVQLARSVKGVTDVKNGIQLKK